jgi:regulator of replication initiation timing
MNREQLQEENKFLRAELKRTRKDLADALEELRAQRAAMRALGMVVR